MILKLKISLLVLMLVSLMAACGDTPTQTPAPTEPPPNPTEIARRAAERINKLQSLHFLVDIKSGEVVLIPGVTFKRAEGDFAKPDRFRAVLRVTIPLGQVEAETVGLEGQQYFLLKNLGNWSTLPADVGFKPDVLFDVNKGIGAVVTKIRDIKLVGVETLNGVEVYHIAGIASGADVGPLTANTLGKTDVNFDAWVDRKEFLVQQVTFKEISTDPKASNWQLNFSDFDKPVTIKKPEIKS